MGFLEVDPTKITKSLKVLSILLMLGYMWSLVLPDPVWIRPNLEAYSFN